MLATLSLALAAASSVLLILNPDLMPQIPRYQLASFQFITISISKNLSLSATITAGVQVENENVVGADIYATIIDIYYPDWSGNLQHIGILRETVTENVNTPSTKISSEASQCRNVRVEGGGDDEKCVESQQLPSPSSTPSSPSTKPFFTLDARGISISDTHALVIMLSDVAPSMYLKMMKDALMAWGVIEIRVSGGVHVKSALLGSIPLTLGFTCNNDLVLFPYPIKLTGKDCVLEGVRTRWARLEDFVFKLKGQTIERYNDVEFL